MPDVKVSVEGLSDLQARLDQLKDADAKRIMNKALRAGAQVFKQEEEQLAPERPELPSGTALPPGALKRDVTIKKARGADNTLLIGPGKYTGRAAHLVEFGHRLVRGGKNRLRAHGIQVGPGTVVGQVPPHPYARPAFEAGQAAATEAIVASLQQDLKAMDRKDLKALNGKRVG